MIALKFHQDAAVGRVLERFLQARDQLRLDVSDADRATARESACVMLEAPTGAGKTLMAGMIAERFSAEEAVVWFWFAPFKGLVTQSGRFLRSQFKGLRVRDLRMDRDPDQARGGDLYVTTWAAVAASDAEGRKIRQKHESLPSLDAFVPLLRERGMRIGVVVDEAHHSFKKQTQALALFRDVLAPDYTLMVTATPDEDEMQAFARELGRRTPGRVVLTREQAVGMGLVKRGIKAVAYLADASVERIVDYEKTALADGWRVHGEIRSALARAGIPIVPLMLVQVQTGGKRDDEARVRRKLIEIGVPERAIAVHTAQEPDPDVLAVAHDESKEVLVFKMKVALGFDAPRAFVLVSSRSSRKTDFGIQVCGRILRVHQRLQGRPDLPALLDFGYVFLADAESQEGLVEAARTMDQVRGDLAGAGAPAVVAVKIGERYTIQRVGPEGPSLLHGLEGDAPSEASVARWLTDGAATIPPLAGDGPLLPGFAPVGAAVPATCEPETVRSMTDHKARPSATARVVYRLRADVPRFLKTHVLPTDYNGLAEDVAKTFNFSEAMLLEGQRELVQVTRGETELFSGATERSRFDARLEPREIERLAQGYLFALDGPNPAVIRDGLRGRLRQAYRERGLEAAADDGQVRRALNLILALHPQALRSAMKQCLFRYAPVQDTFGPLPEEIAFAESPAASRFNAYGILPPDLNEWERAFAVLLDNDLSDTVRWWHRNPQSRPESVCLPLPSGRGYYPDFVVCLNGRKRGDGILLVETKERIYDSLAEEKVDAEHHYYGRPLMLTIEEGRFLSVRFNPQTRRNETDRVFALDWAALYA